LATYIVTDCITKISYNVSGTTFSEGDIIGFSIAEDLFCGVVEQETTDPITPLSLYQSTFTDCCECLSGITDSLNFKFIKCGTEEEFNIEATNFCEQFGTPITGNTYEIQFGSNTPFCATFEGLTPTGETNYSYVSGPFELCEECGQEEPISANTESFFCVKLCTESETTFVSVAGPHPIYTDLYGTPVTQLNMFALGGPNGLNN